MKVQALITIEPVEATSELLMLLGTGTVLGFGTFFKRQLARKSNKITTTSKSFLQ